MYIFFQFKSKIDHLLKHNFFGFFIILFPLHEETNDAKFQLLVLIWHPYKKALLKFEELFNWGIRNKWDIKSGYG